MNLMGRLHRTLVSAGQGITEAQRRLIARTLQQKGVGDIFGLSRDAQLVLMARVVAPHLGMRPEVVESYLRSC